MSHSHHKAKQPLPPTAPEPIAPPPPAPTPPPAAVAVPAEPLPVEETLTEEEQKTLIEAGIPSLNLTSSPTPAAVVPLSSTEQALLRRMKAAVSEPEPGPAKTPNPAMPEKIVPLPLPPRVTPPQERVLPPQSQDPRTVPPVSTVPTRLRYLETPASLPRQVRLQALLAAMSTSGLRYLTTWPRESQQLLYTLNDRLVIDQFADLVPAVEALCFAANMDLRSPAAAGTIAKIAAGILAIWSWDVYTKAAVAVDKAAGQAAKQE